MIGTPTAAPWSLTIGVVFYRPHLAAVMVVGLKRSEKRTRDQVPIGEAFAANDGACADGSKSRWDADWRRVRFS